MAVTIKATFRKDDQPNNGLAAIEDALADKPLERRLVVAIVETSRVTTDVDDDKRTVQVRHVYIEPMLSDEDRKAAQDLLDEARRTRLGRATEPTLFDSTGPEE